MFGRCTENAIAQSTQDLFANFAEKLWGLAELGDAANSL